MKKIYFLVTMIMMTAVTARSQEKDYNPAGTAIAMNDPLSYPYTLDNKDHSGTGSYHKPFQVNPGSPQSDPSSNPITEGTLYKRRPYLRVGGGFGVGLCYDDPCEYNDDLRYGSYDNISTSSASYGTGGNVSLAGGYMFNKYIGVELGLNDNWGLKKTQTQAYQGGEGGASNTVYKRWAMTFDVIPALVVTPGFDTWNPYARFGFSMGVYPAVYSTETNTAGSVITKTTGVYSGGFPLGYSAALGVEYKLSNSFQLNVEANCDGMNYAPNKYMIKTYTINSVDHMNDLTPKQITTNYVTSFDQSVTIPNDSPNKALRKYFPLSNVSLNVGLKYTFGGGKTASE